MTAVSAARRAHPRASRGPGDLTVAGVAGGVGTTTVASALGGIDAGVYTGGRVQVLVCRATGDSLVRAGAALRHATAVGARAPVIAVTLGQPLLRSRSVSARLRLLEPNARAVVVLPYMRRWRDLSVPLDEVRLFLAVAPADLPRHLRRYATAMHQLRSALHRPTSASPASTSGRPELHPSALRRIR